MDRIVNIHEAKTHLSRLLAGVMSGEEIIVAKAGEPAARLIPVDRKPVKRQPGGAADVITMSDEFDDPLPDEILREFEK